MGPPHLSDHPFPCACGCSVCALVSRKLLLRTRRCFCRRGVGQALDGGPAGRFRHTSIWTSRPFSEVGRGASSPLCLSFLVPALGRCLGSGALPTISRDRVPGEDRESLPPRNLRGSTSLTSPGYSHRLLDHTPPPLTPPTRTGTPTFVLGDPP